jgi:hypothetical protein
MLLALAIYGCAASFYYRLRWHNKTVALSNPTFLKRLVRGYFRGMIPLTIAGTILILAADGVIADPLGPGMREWFRSYFSSHSVIWWFLWNLIAYVVIAIPKEATYKSALYPATYGPEETKNAEIHRINMSNSLIWNTIFWVAVFVNPALPFGNSLVHLL